jgi:hypothetical protein
MIMRAVTNLVGEIEYYFRKFGEKKNCDNNNFFRGGRKN